MSREHQQIHLSYRQGSRTYNLLVTRVSANATHERYRIGNEAQGIIVEGNRPLLVAKGLKKKAIQWRVIEGQVKYPRNLEDILMLLENTLRNTGASK